VGFFLLSELCFDALLPQDALTCELCLSHEVGLDHDAPLGLETLIFVLEVVWLLNSFNVDLEGVEEYAFCDGSILDV
jgi:hypothetical protein